MSENHREYYIFIYFNPKKNVEGTERVYVNYFCCQKPRFFSRRAFWRAEQTQIEFVELEERLVGEKMAFFRQRNEFAYTL